MDTNSDKEVAATLIDKYLSDMSFVCGASVVMRGIRLYLLSIDKTVVNLSSFTSD